MSARLSCLFALGLALSCGSEAESRPPNIILILADDAGIGNFGCYGATQIRTPNIDALARGGMRFLEHYAGSSMCAPSRCTLLTGQHTGRARVRGNSLVALRPEQETLAEVLKRGGYRTACYGKWGLGEKRSAGEPLEHGFDEFFGFTHAQLRHNRYFPPEMTSNGDTVALEPGTYSQDLVTERAVGFIRDNAERPFFLYLPYCIPHAPLLVPEDALEPYTGSMGSETPFVDPNAPAHSQTQPRAAYAAMLTRLDDYVGQITAALDEAGLAESTLILFTSDNGPATAGGADPSYFASAAAYRGGKASLYEGGIRAPLIARWPSQVAPGTTSSHLSGFWDILPTCAELAGLPVPEGVNGVSFAATLRGTPAEQGPHKFLYWELSEPDFANRPRGWQALRFESWKAVRRDVSRVPDAPVELFDLSADPSESRDLAGSHPEVARRARELMQRAHAKSRLFPLLRDEIEAHGDGVWSQSGF